MKKIIFSFILGIGFGAYGYAAHKPNFIQNQQNSTVEVEQDKKTQRYDFSLYKFALPKVNKKQDSSKKEIPKLPEVKLKGETTYNYEIPFSFFKFS